MPYKDPASQAAYQAAYRDFRRRQLTDDDRELLRTNNALRMRTMRALGKYKEAPAMQSRDFIGVDGEGGGKDDRGRQHYLLLRAGDELLFDNNRPLTTIECLEFLTSLDPKHIYVAYYFDYDVTQILRDLSAAKRDRLCHPTGDYSKNSVWFDDYRIMYLPHKHFKVAKRIGGTDKNPEWSKFITINDVGSFFQCSFYKAITDWNIGDPDTRAKIKVGKEARDSFQLMTESEIEYNRVECEYLAELMTQFRDVCITSGYTPTQWQGPGYLASNMLGKHGIVKRQELALSDRLLEFANAGYYGGRSEITKIGAIKNVWEADINSAYPYAMLQLPCLEHGSWNERNGKPNGSIYVASVHFFHSSGVLCNLPIRDKKTGSIYWPVEGNGVFWCWEIEAAIRAGTTIKAWGKHWSYKCECDCQPFKWVEEVYQLRNILGKGTKGYAVKLAINSLYGKTAQSIGAAPYANPIWAGLITAHSRAKLIDTYTSMDRRSIVMLATDAIYSTEKPEVDEGKELGQWEVKHHNEIFLVQPGVYFIEGAPRPKTRGVPTIVLQRYEAEFREAFQRWLDTPKPTLFSDREPDDFPSVKVKIHAFIGMKLANAWGRPFDAGKWVDNTREISYNFTRKRRFACIEDNHVETFPRRGSDSLHSMPYSKHIGLWRKEAEEWNALLASQPDHLEFNPNERPDE